MSETLIYPSFVVASVIGGHCLASRFAHPRILSLRQ